MSKKIKDEDEMPQARHISPDTLTKKLNSKLRKGESNEDDDIFFQNQINKIEDTEMNVIPPINDPFKGFTDLSIYDDKKKAFKQQPIKLK